MATHEQIEILAAAILDTLAEYGQREYSGRLPELIAAVRNSWFGDYTDQDFESALEVLSRVRGTERSYRESTSDFIRVNQSLALVVLNGAGNQRFNPRKALPLLFEYSQFGRDWLHKVWDEYFGANSDELTPDSEAIYALEAKLIPAANRYVDNKDNSPPKEDVIEKLEDSVEIIDRSNTLSVNEKSDTLLYLRGGIELIKSVKRLSIGAMKFLVLDRLKSVIEGSIEDVYKTILTAVFIAVATYLLAFL